MRFIDEARIDVRGGRGGHGCMSFRREKFVPRGGPDGGDGGRGGSVVLIADPNQTTLLDQRYRRIYHAPNGSNGGSANCTGASGKDLVVRVPPGTLVRDEADGTLLVDLATPGQRFVVAAGGDGGRGNARFSTSTHQAPRRAEDGWPGTTRTITLELKLLADVGLVGLPNAGKSTLIRRISASRARVADYPFTTLVPNLGVVSVGDGRTFVVADVPGLIEGAADGAGLGHQFLRHVERARTLVHLVPVMGDMDPVDAWRTVENELDAYSDELAGKSRIVVLSKADLLPDDESIASIRERFPAEVGRVFAISAATGAGLDEFLSAVADQAFEAKPDDGRPAEPTLR